MAKIKNNRIGEETIASNGQTMKIIAYRNYQDIDVEFEDKIKVYHKSYGKFKLGYIANPNLTAREVIANRLKEKYQNRNLGKTTKASNGMMIKIIAYRNSEDIDVEFEDGKIVTGVSVYCFEKGWVKYENAKERIKQTAIASNGMQMKIHKYRSAHDIDVIFEDGEIVHNRTYASFLKGLIRHPTKNVYTSANEDLRKQRVGEKTVANNGLIMEIIEYRNSHDIDVKFEDGEIVRHKVYYQFLHGNIRHPHIHPYKRKRNRKE